jgi:hypothetical protein
MEMVQAEKDPAAVLDSRQARKHCSAGKAAVLLKREHFQIDIKLLISVLRCAMAKSLR